MNIYRSVYGINTITVVKTGEGKIFGVSTVVSGSVAGGIFDTATTSGASALGPLVTYIPTVTGMPLNIPELGWYCQSGITVVPGSGQVVNITFQ